MLNHFFFHKQPGNSKQTVTVLVYGPRIHMNCLFEELNSLQTILCIIVIKR